MIFYLFQFHFSNTSEQNERKCDISYCKTLMQHFINYTCMYTENNAFYSTLLFVLIMNINLTKKKTIVLSKSENILYGIMN